jgi:predicted hydrocarbon binding protein
MSGGISFKNDIYWSTAGWAYRAVLESLCEEMSRSNSFELLEELSEEYGSARIIEYIETDEWPDARVIAFCKTIKNAFAYTESAGPVGWNDPGAFKGFIQHYKKLVEIAELECAKRS